ncbi:MAG: hypothetical protein V2J24_11180 [Pseudomonadales bacterium]|nr:hypothetical protein [Pseudomonadales bacterium]
MKISRDPDSRMWTLTSDGRVLYAGRRSPWEDPRLMRAALKRERDASRTEHGQLPRRF